MGAFSLPIGLTGNLFNLWGLTRGARTDEPLDTATEATAESRDDTVEDAAAQLAEARGTEQ